VEIGSPYGFAKARDKKNLLQSDLKNDVTKKGEKRGGEGLRISDSLEEN